VALLLLAWHHAGFSLDDPFISFRYARNLIDGHGLVFSIGERVEGYSNLLWILLLVPFMWAGVDPVPVAKAGGLFFAAASILVVTRTARLLFAGGEGFWIGLAAATLIGASSYYALWSVGQLETMLFSFLLVLAFHLHARSVSRDAGEGAAADWSWVPLALLCLTRPEAPLIFLVFLFAKLIAVRGARERVPGVIGWALGFAAVFGAFLAWRWTYYGDLLPNTYYAKTSGGASQIAPGRAYLAEGFTTQGAIFTGLTVVACGGLVYYLHRSRDGLTGLLVAVAIAYAGFIILAGGDWMAGFRFLMQVHAVLMLLVATGLHQVVLLVQRARRGGQRGTTAGPRAATAAGAVAVLLAVLMAGTSVRASNAHLRQALPWLESRLGQAIGFEPGGPYFQVAQYLDEHVPAGSWVALGEAGVIPYYAAHVNVIDVLGLMDRHIARLPGLLHEKGDAAYVLDRRPDYILLLAAEDDEGTIRYAGPPMQQFYDHPAFAEHYRLIFKLGRGLMGDLHDHFYLYERRPEQPGPIDYDLDGGFERTRRLGEAPRPEIPWGSSIARIVAADFGDAWDTAGAWAFLAAPNTIVAYDLVLPPGTPMALRGAVAGHPLARDWGSDGFRMRVEIVDGIRVERALDLYVDPAAAPVPFEVPLEDVSGKAITLNLIVFNDPGRVETSDWPVWLDLRIAPR
jgi:hypothetical protein